MISSLRSRLRWWCETFLRLGPIKGSVVIRLARCEHKLTPVCLYVSDCRSQHMGSYQLSCRAHIHRHIRLVGGGLCTPCFEHGPAATKGLEGQKSSFESPSLVSPACWGSDSVHKPGFCHYTHCTDHICRFRSRIRTSSWLVMSSKPCTCHSTLLDVDCHAV